MSFHPSQQIPVRVGELNSYARLPAFTGPYRNAMQMAVDEINLLGGIHSLGGRKLEIIFRDDGGNPSDAVRVAERLISLDKVDFLAGTFLSNVALAIASRQSSKNSISSDRTSFGRAHNGKRQPIHFSDFELIYVC